jgi:hypothetical protein
MRGTLKELAGKVTVNGREASVLELTVLFSLGLATEVGKVKVEGARGKPATIWELQASGLVEFGTVEAPATPEAVTEAPAVEAPAEAVTADNVDAVTL